MLRRLSPRDWEIVRLLYQHRVLTTQHVCDALFPSRRTAEMRLLDLYQLRVVDRFRPFTRTGSAPYHWILDEVGAQLIAWDRGQDLKQLGWRRDRALGIAASRQLVHRLGVNAFFCALLREARQRAGCRLSAWLSQPRLKSSEARVEPDGFGVWEEAGVQLPFYLEYDCGTERLERLAEKLRAYRRYIEDAIRNPDSLWFAGAPIAYLVLFAFPGPEREANARRTLRDVGVPLATALDARCWTAVTPASAIWAPLGGAGGGRRPLIDLPRVWASQATTSANGAKDNGDAWDRPRAEAPPLGRAAPDDDSWDEASPDIWA